MLLLSGDVISFNIDAFRRVYTYPFTGGSLKTTLLYHDRVRYYYGMGKCISILRLLFFLLFCGLGLVGSSSRLAHEGCPEMGLFTLRFQTP